MNYLSVFDHFVKLALKGLILIFKIAIANESNSLVNKQTNKQTNKQNED